MTTLYRAENWPENLLDELFGFRREFDEMFNRITSRRTQIAEPELKNAFSMAPAVETYVDKEAKKYVCRVVLPGVELKNVEVQLHGELLTIRAERKITQEKREVQYFEEEIAYGKFERVLPLPAGVVAEKLTALFANGVLEVIAPLAALALPRKVEIKPAVPFTKQVAA